MNATTPRPPNMERVALAAGLSKSSVSLALRDDPRLSPSTRAHVQHIAAALGYKRNPLVSSLMTQLRQASFQPAPYIGPLACFGFPPDQLSAFRIHAQAEGFSLDLMPSAVGTYINPSPARTLAILQARSIRGILQHGPSPLLPADIPSVRVSSPDQLAPAFAVLTALIRIRSTSHASIAP